VLHGHGGCQADGCGVGKCCHRVRPKWMSGRGVDQ
jgi:hypothetical protein